MTVFKKLIVAGSILATTAQAASIVRFFELTTDPKEKASYNQVGVENLTTSIKNEKGTLAMYTSHKSDNPSINYVVEIYESDEAYQVHANSPQFKKFVEVAKTAVKSRKVFETNPQFLAEKKEPLYIEKANKQKVILAEVLVSADKNEEFKKHVLEELKQAMEKEKDILLAYAVTLKDEPNKWYFFEVYKNNEAFLEHRNSDYIKKYTENTKDMVLSRNIMELKGDTLVNKGGLYLEF